MKWNETFQNLCNLLEGPIRLFDIFCLLSSNKADFDNIIYTLF